MSTPTKFQTDQTVNEAALPVTRKAARAQLDTIVPGFDQNFDAPLRMFASNPFDSKVNFQAQQFQRADGVGQSIPPISSQVPTVVASTIDFQANTTTGATFTLVWPTTGTVGRFRRVGFTLLATGTISALFSAEATTVGGLANPGTLFISGSLPIGWMDIQCTGTASSKTQYKTANSATNIIENSVSGTSTVVIFGSGGGGGGSGNANELVDRLMAEFNENYYNYLTPSVFAQSVSLVDGSNTTSSSDPTDNSYLFSAGAQTLTSLQLLDPDFLTAGKDITQVHLTMFWKYGSIDPAAIYSVSRDGGVSYQTAALTQVGSDDTFSGLFVFANTETPSALESYLVSNADTTVALNATTQQQQSIPFVVASAQVLTQLEVYLNKTGAPAGNFTLSIVKDSSGNPSTVSTDNLGSTAPVSISALATGNNTSLVSLLGAVVLPAGTYHIVVSTDASYTASFASGTVQVALRAKASGPGPVERFYNGTSWSAGTASVCYRALGRSLDLRVKVVSSTSAVKLFGYGISYDSTPMLISGKFEAQQFTFLGSANQNSFVLTNFLPNPNTLKVYDVTTGQVYVSPAFDINGQTVTFPVNMFNLPGQTIVLSFDQTQGAAIDTKDANSSAIANIKAQEASGFQGFVDQTSLIAVPFTTVVGRAQIVDPSQDLKPRIGVERIMTQQLVLVQNEFGPNGEQVWGVLNDTAGAIRFVGNWSGIGQNTWGSAQGSGVVNDYVEITFYGTHLNILGYYIASTMPTVTVTVDGSQVNANLFGGISTGSAVLTNRNYAANQVTPVVSGLALGLHTVILKITAVPGAFFSCYGFETINSSSSVAVNPGIAYIGGNKLSLASAQSIPYNSTFESGTLGTRGGRVVVYQKSDGTIAKAVQPANTSAAYYPSADHTNEEIARRYNFREFGAGRTDDYSLLTTTQNAGFTLDDGITSLTGVQNLFANGNNLRITGASGGQATLTFVGTGLDMILQNGSLGTNGSGGYTFYVDGVLQATLPTVSSSTVPYQFKICSGLPYGTHTVRMLLSAVSSWETGIRDFIVYQPKKPSVPAGAVELADYNVMADFVNDTAGPASATDLGMSSGVLFKAPTREAVYVGTHVINGSVNPSWTSGWDSQTSTNGDYFEYSFWGTGIEHRTWYGSTSTYGITYLIDGIALNTGANTGSTASIHSSQLGSMVISAAGVVSGTSGAGSGYGSKVRISGLPLGRHTLRVTRNSISGGDTGMYTSGLDIITPIHSVKSNLYGDIQNALPVGSCAISDNRKIIPVKEILPVTKAWAQAVGVSGSPTTTSTSFVPMPDMSCTIKTSGGPLKISFVGSGYANAANVSILSRIYVDGVAILNEQLSLVPTVGNSQVIQQAIVPVSVGVHKVDIFWAATGSTVTIEQLRRVLTVEEK